MKVKIINKSTNEAPAYATEGAAGMDLRANENVSIYPNDRVIIKTGIFIQLPPWYEAQIRPRSGMAIKHGITVLNAPGTIDSDYTGEIGVILHNVSDTKYDVNRGDKIAQMVIAKYENVEWNEVDKLEETQRGDGGYGHTGI